MSYSNALVTRFVQLLDFCALITVTFPSLRCKPLPLLKSYLFMFQLIQLMAREQIWRLIASNFTSLSLLDRLSLASIWHWVGSSLPVATGWASQSDNVKYVHEETKTHPPSIRIKPIYHKYRPNHNLVTNKSSWLTSDHSSDVSLKPALCRTTHTSISP